MVSDDLLFEEAPEHQDEAAADVGQIEPVARSELRRERVIAADWTLNELREKGDKQRKPEDIALRRVFAVVHVDEIAHRLEGIKGNAQRHEEPDGRRAAFAHQAVQSGERRRRRGGDVFEHRQHAEIEQQCEIE